MKKTMHAESQNKNSDVQIEKFDYSDLSTNQLSMVQQETTRIRQHLDRTVAHMLEAGAGLITVKEVLPHGRFQAWLKAEFNWSARTAARYMTAAKLFRGKLNVSLDLEVTLIYRLAARSTPAPIRAEILSEIEQGRRPSLTEIRNRIREAIKTDLQLVSAGGEEKLRQPTHSVVTAASHSLETPDCSGAVASQSVADLILVCLGFLDDTFIAMLRHVDAADLLQRLIEGVTSRTSR